MTGTTKRCGLTIMSEGPSDSGRTVFARALGGPHRRSVPRRPPTSRRLGRLLQYYGAAALPPSESGPVRVRHTPALSPRRPMRSVSRRSLRSRRRRRARSASAGQSPCRPPVRPGVERCAERDSDGRGTRRIFDGAAGAPRYGSLYVRADD